ncbi:hypothetical protein M0R45_004223 [Rubus argutus]|uniref:Uncharacterized protein n=1 Tax=Rubus argutus TaxID=59490 RepID=A0AAW1YJ67_RUBAR
MPSAILPKVNSTIHSRFWRVIRQGGTRNSKNLLPYQGKLLSQKPGLARSLPCSTLLVADATRYSFSSLHQGKSMAASSSKPVFGDLYVDDLIASTGNGLDFTKPAGVFFNDRSRSSFLKASLSLRRKESFNSRLISAHVGPWSRNFHTSSMCYAAGAAQDVSLDGNSNDEQLANSTVLSDQTLKLLSGSCYLPHPDKEETGGEDAHFICGRCTGNWCSGWCRWMG